MLIDKIVAIIRAARRGKTGKTVVLPGFCGIERGGGIGGNPAMCVDVSRGAQGANAPS